MNISDTSNKEQNIPTLNLKLYQLCVFISGGKYLISMVNVYHLYKIVHSASQPGLLQSPNNMDEHSADLQLEE